MCAPPCPASLLVSINSKVLRIGHSLVLLPSSIFQSASESLCSVLCIWVFSCMFWNLTAQYVLWHTEAVASVDFCTIDGSLRDWWIWKLGYDTSIYADTGSGSFLKEVLYLLVPGSVFPYRKMKVLFQGRKEIDFKVLLSTVCHQCYTCLTTCSLTEFSCFYKSKSPTVTLLSCSEYHFQFRCHLFFLSSRLPWFSVATTFVEDDLMKMVPLY